MKKFIPYLIAIVAIILVWILWTSNKDLKLVRDALNIQINEISRQDDLKKQHIEKLNDKIADFNDSISEVNLAITKQRKRETAIINSYERRLAEIEQLNEQQADTFLTNRYPDSRAIVRDLVAFEHCKDMLINKEGEVILLEAKTILQDSIIINQDSIIADLFKRIELKDEMIALIGQKADLAERHMKRMRRQRNGAIGGGVGIAVMALIL